MKRFLYLATLALGLQMASVANAQYCNLAFCSTGVNVDSGSSAENCYGAEIDCNCTQVARVDAWCSTRVQATSPGAGWIDYLDAVGGQTCWVKNQSCPPNVSAELEESVTGSDNGLSEVFGTPNSPLFTEAHFGWVGTVSRSSNIGRTTSAGARLDVCLGYADVDFITGLASTDADRYSYCAGSTYGCGTTSKNEYCNNVGGNGLTVCQDRCACYYNQTGCDNY